MSGRAAIRALNREKKKVMNFRQLTNVITFRKTSLIGVKPNTKNFYGILDQSLKD